MLYHSIEHSRVSLTFSEGVGHLSCKFQACNVHVPVECTVRARDYSLHVRIMWTPQHSYLTNNDGITQKRS